jgi:hypothetical protein
LPQGFKAETLAAFGLRPEVVNPGDSHCEYTGACVVARPCDIDISLRPSASQAPRSGRNAHARNLFRASLGGPR